MKKTILHLCADTGSDSWPYQLDDAYEVITVGSDIGVENYTPDRPIHGVIANPVCTEFSAARYGNTFDLIPEFHESGMPKPNTDAELRSLCSQKFAQAFKSVNP